MSLTYGFEQELFISPKDDPTKYVVAPAGLPMDDCRYLAEARGDPSSDYRKARHLFNASVESLHAQAAKLGLSLQRIPSAPLSREFVRSIVRHYGKTQSRSWFVGGRGYRGTFKPRAGLHIHFGSVSGSSTPLNTPRIIGFLDAVFKEEIREARRVPGEYEFKPHGFEYRSLPNNVDMDKVVKALGDLEDELNGVIKIEDAPLGVKVG